MSYRKLIELTEKELRLLSLYGRCHCGAPRRAYRTEIEGEIRVSLACADHPEHGPDEVRA